MGVVVVVVTVTDKSRMQIHVHERYAESAHERRGGQRVCVCTVFHCPMLIACHCTRSEHIDGEIEVQLKSIRVHLVPGSKMYSLIIVIF